MTDLVDGSPGVIFVSEPGKPDGIRTGFFEVDCRAVDG
jgi:hypothetical protein